MASTELPWRGLGLSSNLDASLAPNPYQMDRSLFDFVEYSAPLNLAQAREEASLFETMWAARAQVPVLFHPVHLNLYGPTLESEEALRDLDEHARAVESAWVGNDVGWWHEGGKPFPGYLYLPPPLNEAGVHDATAHALHVQSRLSVPLLLENPAIIGTRGELHVLDFMARLHARTGLPLLIDVGHLWSYQLSRGLGPDAAFDGFPWEMVAEVHLAGGVATSRSARRFYVDDHTQPVREELFELLEKIVQRARRLRAITFEGDGHPNAIAARTLKRLRPLVDAARNSNGVVAAVGGGEGGRGGVAFQLQTRPWEIYEERYGARAPSEDPEGTEAELDFRAAVVAEELDREMPWTRLLIAGTRAELGQFTASASFRDLFTGMARDLHHAFASYARRRARELLDPGIERVVAFETWLHSVRSAGGSDSDGWRLARDVVAAEFPADLSEVAFCAKALRRHLAARAWASERLETSGLEALRQAASRAPASPWSFVARKTRHRAEVLILPPEVVAAVVAVQRRVPIEEIDAAALRAAVEQGLVVPQ